MQTSGLCSRKPSHMIILHGKGAVDRRSDGIVTAIDSGLLELHEFAGDADFGWAAAGPERQIAKTEEFVDLVAGAVVDRTTYPVFDADAAQSARWAVEQGVVSPFGSADQEGPARGLGRRPVGKAKSESSSGTTFGSTCQRATSRTVVPNTL